MNNLPESFGLHCPDGREAQLLGVKVHIEILGLMMRLTVRQTWRNASGAPMATRLSFPLGADQTLLQLQMQRQPGSQLLRSITRASRVRCTATPGVLSTGEQVTFEWRTGQWLQLQGTSLRLQIPAALVPKATHPAQIQVEIHDPVASGTVSCPSHNMRKVRHANGVTLSMSAEDGLSKDLLLTAHGLGDTVFAVASPDPGETGHCTVLNSIRPHLPAHLPAPGSAQNTATPGALRMKLLIDSSSAMPADRLSQIRSALDKLLTQLQPEDQLSYSRFGEATLHDLPRLQVCTEAYQKRVRSLARHTDTDLGPAKPLDALQAVLAIPDEEEEAVKDVDMVLITASPIWAIEAPLRTLHAGQHRLHVLTLGNACNSLWSDLAEASGGSCETLGTGHNSLQSLTRLIERIRSRPTWRAHMTLEGAPLQATPNPQHLLSHGDTLHLWTRVTTPPPHEDLTGRPELQTVLHWQPSDAPDACHSQPATTVLWDEQGDLARLCAAREARLLDNDAERARLLQAYQLPQIDHTRWAAAAMPTAPVPSTAPAPATQRPKVLPVALAPSAASPAPVHSLRHTPARHADLAGWLSEPDAPANPLTALVQTFNAHAGAYGQFRAALSSTLHQVSIRFLDTLVLQLTRRAGNPGRVWALLLHWLHAEHDMALHAQAIALVQQELSSMPVGLRTEIHDALASAAMPQTKRHAA